MLEAANAGVYHNAADINMIGNLGAAESAQGPATATLVDQFSYDFKNFFHPFVGDLIKQLNLNSVAGLLDPDFLATLDLPYTAADYTPTISKLVSVTLEERVIDTSVGGPYANYNWELLYHIPVMIAVNLSNNQRFAEAQQWFHLVFDPTSRDTSVPAPQRYWRSFVFRGDIDPANINTLLTLLSTPDSQLDPAQLQAKADVITGYNAILASPFSPHVVARTRPSAYQWYVVMKYLDNLIAWGDSLFLADTIETINEATLCYVLAANILGPRPDVMPATGTSATKNFLQLKQAGLDQLSNALISLEAQFPFNLVQGPGGGGGSAQQDQSGALFGIGRSLYFCVPQNAKLLSYWDTVADRLFKIRNSENIQGVYQQLPLFDPPLDPGMLVQAAASGIDLSSVLAGLNQPIGPTRSPLLIAKSLEIAEQVRALGNGLLAALEKKDAEHLALLRQGHEVELQQMIQNVRYLQWQHAQEVTNGLLKTRAVTLERYGYYLRLLGLAPDPDTAPPVLALDRRELTEDNFGDTYATLVSEYDLPIAELAYNPLQLAQGSSPSAQAGATGQGQLYLSQTEDSELNTHLPAARNLRRDANIANTVAGAVTPIPSVEGHLAFWGIGLHSVVFSGQILAGVSKIAAEILQTFSAWNTDQAGIEARTATFQRRADEWTFQANLAGRELAQIGRQIIASLIAEQVAWHDYQTAQTQVKQAQEVQDFLSGKFTSETMYAWMISELSGLYYQYYRFACDTARKAEQTMKQELMRPELDSTQFIQFNYWDSGHQGLLSGDALHLDIKRMEMAYHDNNKREIELTRHVSLRQLDPLALLALRITGSCTVTIPEWLYDRDCPGHYMRRIKQVSLSVPCVVGPYASVNCTVTLQSSSLRVSPLLAGGVYARSTSQQDDRFVDYFGSTDVIVTSGGSMDSGMFETNLHDDRFLPFEGAGAISTWTLTLPTELQAFDYSTISDAIMHVRYTARQAGDPLGAQATKELVAMLDTAGAAGQAQLYCLRYDFPTEWSAFVNGTADFTCTLDKRFFPYAVQSARKLTIDSVTVYTGYAGAVASVTPAVDLAALSAGLSGASGQATLDLPADGAVLTRDFASQVFVVLAYHFGVS